MSNAASPTQTHVKDVPGPTQTHVKDVPDHGDGLIHPTHPPTELDGHKKPTLTLEGDIKILKTVDLHCNSGMCCKFSEDAEKLAVGLFNGDIKVFFAKTGHLEYHLADEETKRARLPVTSMNFIPAHASSRGELLIATYASGMIKFWHIATSTSLAVINQQCQFLTSSLSPTGYDCLIAGGSGEEIFVYDVETHKQIRKCAPSPNRLVMDGHRFRICCLKYHPTEECTFLSGGWDDTVQIWDWRAEHSIRRIYGPHVCGDGIDLDEHGHILTASWRAHDVLQVWDYETGNRIRNIPPDFSANSSLYSGQFLGKEHIICGGSDNNMIRIIDRKSLATTGMITNLPSGVYSIDHDRARLSRHHHHHNQRHNETTLIAAVAGDRLYFISNAKVQEKRE